MVKRANIVGGLVVEGRLDGDHAWNRLDDMDECATVVAHRHRLEIRLGFPAGSVQMYLPVGPAPVSRFAYLFVSLKRSIVDTKLAMRIDTVEGMEHIDREVNARAVALGQGFTEWDFSDDFDGWCRFGWVGQSLRSPSDSVRVHGFAGGIQTALIRTAGRYTGPVSLI